MRAVLSNKKYSKLINDVTESTFGIKLSSVRHSENKYVT